ncbi:hypothetical protein [Alteromonas macleodii]|uniref:Uncharacterized protein n=1 Tax=Alteromonas macleodii TaxID=28108 RepID=A0AB36FN41_ALTMA|nr:hypothetical protein [Alteromonas macleodii]OES24155.1 hypothetical protein BFV93_4755 [Alteromonas macleodii]OES24789.1 hypothetical protein BFV95_4548 [Alteromonas macleodii]OES25067.1 hypothetical protein BFV94_4538 [Alteromonas macleodii]OES39110.1 hypothetical protein BFV96_4258 [Alteromonas macleodii]
MSKYPTNTVSIDIDSLDTYKASFREFVQLDNLIKQKLSNLDNLYALSLGYQHGFGNLKAACKQGFDFDIHNVNVQALVQFEVNNISCGCGVEAYLNSYLNMGVDMMALSRFVHEYFAYKAIYDLWRTFTSKNCTEILSQELDSLARGTRWDISECPSAFVYHPGFGLFNHHFLRTVTFEDLDLQCLQKDICTLYEHDCVQHGLLNIYDDAIKQDVISVIKKIRQHIPFTKLANNILSQMRYVNDQNRLIDVRAYLFYFTECGDVETFMDVGTGRTDWTIYFIDGYLVSKKDSHFDSVCLIERESAEVRKHFTLYGKTDITRRFIIQLWKKNKAQGSSTARVAHQEWNTALDCVSESIKTDAYFSVNAHLKRQLSRYGIVEECH